MISTTSRAAQRPLAPRGERARPVVDSRSSASAIRLLVVSLWAFGIALAGIQAWAAIRSESMNADGVSYLDIGDAYAAGDWAGAISSVWSPFYSWLLAITRTLAGGTRPELAIVHLTNLGIFLLALLAFSFLERELARNAAESARADERPLPRWGWELLSHLAFFWAALCLITIWAVTPDMLMAAFVCLASALIVRIRRGSDGPLVYVALGLTLGAAYLAKAVMFPLGIVFLMAGAFAARSWRAALPRATLAGAAFLVVSAPWMLAVSAHEGRPTFGEAGRITYLRHVNEIPYPHWQGEAAGLGRPTHPSRMLLQDPPVFEFGSPVSGTYPISYDPAYWYAGAVPRFDFRQQANAILRNAVVYHELILNALGGLLACVLLLRVLAPPQSWRLVGLLRRSTLLLPVAAALVLYGLVYVEGRYIGVFLMLLVLESVAGIRARRALPPALMTASCLLMATFLAGNILAFHVRGQAALTGNPVAAGAPAASPSEVAEHLRKLGMVEGDAVGVVGYAFDSFWARAAGVRIVAELLASDAGPLWAGDPAVERRVLLAFAHAGARAVVAENVPTHRDMSGWQRVSLSSYYVKRIDQALGG